MNFENVHIASLVLIEPFVSTQVSTFWDSGSFQDDGTR